jgi:hypothetical protein
MCPPLSDCAKTENESAFNPSNVQQYAQMIGHLFSGAKWSLLSSSWNLMLVYA